MKRDGGHEVQPVGHAPMENHIPISIWHTVELIDLQKKNDTDFCGQIWEELENVDDYDKNKLKVSKTIKVFLSF